MPGGDGCYGEKQHRIGGQSVIPQRFTREGTLVMFDQEPGGSEGMSEALIWEKVFQAEGIIA